MSNTNIVHVLIEFDAAAPRNGGTLDAWWQELKRRVTNALAGVTTHDKLEFTHTSGDPHRDAELRQAELATEALQKITALLNAVEPKRRLSILKLLTQNSD